MSQKSILSYFKSKDQNNVEKANSKTKSVKIVNSPVKKEKRKALRLQSDDESEESETIPKKKPCTEVTETSKASVSNGEKETTLKKNEETTEDNQDDKPAKKEVLENGRQEESPSTTKAEKNNCENVSSSGDAGNTSAQSTEIAEKAGVSESDSIIFTGKRKTARKQMYSKNILGSNVQNVSVNGDTTENATSELVDNENSDSKKQLTKDVPKSPKQAVKEAGKENSKTAKNVTSEAVDSENSDSKKELTKDVPKSPKPTVKETGNEDSKKRGVKHKSKAADKVESSPVKKTKKETLHSFFAPLKVPEKNSTKEGSTESKETTTVKIEAKECDSPVKKIKKKKTQCLESDEESNDGSDEETAVIKTEPEESPKKNTDNEQLLKEKADLNSEEKKEEKPKILNVKNESEEKKEEKAKILDLKNESEGNELSQPSNKEGKQKLSVKSTSADASVYDPSKSNYHPINDAIWKRNDKVPYLALSKTLELIEKTSGRLKTIEILSNFFRSVMVLSPDDMLQSVYLCLNRVAPEYEGIEMGVGDNLLMKAVAQATGRTVDKIKAEVAVKGDLGLVSESSRGNQRIMFPLPKLTVSAVFNKFREIAKMSGNAVMTKKTDMIKNLFIACRDCEAKYLIRSLSGKLRIGLAEQSILSAVARAAVVTPPNQSYPPEKIDASKGMSPEKFKEFLDSQTLILKTAYCECPNYDIIIPVLLKEGISGLPEKCHLSPGVPLKPMLAHPTTGISNVLQRFDKQAFTCEFKYDGERAQIHMNEKGEIKIFSRNQEDNTSKFPDIISRIKNALKESTQSFILDSEVVAWDREKKQILPFQVLSTRKRKDAVESDIVVQVCVMAFDLIYLNGESLVKKPLKERRSLLHSFFTEVEDQFMFAKFKDGDTAEAMQEFLDESVKGNCEGLMVKALEVDASYEIAKRSHNWLKLKKDYLQGVGDTLDLVVIGGYYGKGKRTGNYGGFLLACYDPDETQEYQTICKLGTGFKENELEAHTKFLKQHIIENPRSDYRYDPSAKAPDHWFDPVQVWEIKCADLSISPDYKAAIGIVDPSKGISLRFPRFVRIREDKTPELATSAVQIADMYRKQQQVQNSSKGNSTNEEDYY